MVALEAEEVFGGVVVAVVDFVEELQATVVALGVGLCFVFPFGKVREGFVLFQDPFSLVWVRSLSGVDVLLQALMEDDES